MGEVMPDFSFVRDGRNLSEWLIDLVSEDRPVREAAGEALGGMWHGYPRYSTSIYEVDLSAGREFEVQRQRFAEAVRMAVEAPDFTKAEFVRKLCFLRIALNDEWVRTVEKSGLHDPKLDALETRLIEKALTARDDAERAHAVRRYARLFCASLERDKKLFATAESSSASGFTSYLVFNALDGAFLADTGGLLAMLKNQDLSNYALEALARIGPPAREFATYLLDRTSKDPWLFDGARALGSVGRGDPEIVDALIERLRGAKRGMAAQTLKYMGPDLAGREDEAITLLLQATLESDDLTFTVPALASVGRNRVDALQRVIELASPRPPRWEADPYGPDGRYDMVMWERGMAIEALEYFTAFPEPVVPVLIGAFDDFIEYDPDYQYDGEHVRVCGVLEKFGAAAAPIVPHIIAYLEEWFARRPIERDPYPKDAFNLLAAIGGPAKNALPLLERIHQQENDRGQELNTFFPLDRAIHRIRNQ